MTITPISKEKLEELKVYALTCDRRAMSCIMSAHKLQEVIALAERALEPRCDGHNLVFSVTIDDGKAIANVHEIKSGGEKKLWFVSACPATDGYAVFNFSLHVNQDHLERALEPQGQALPDDCDVRKIMLRVDPGPDGMGVEVYAQNVGEVEALLSELGNKAEEAYASQLALPAGPVPALSRQQVFDKFSFLEGVVNEFYYRQIAETAIVMLAEQSLAVAQPEPDWSASKTLISEAWKNPLTPMGERLQIADGAVRFRDDVIANLRKQLAEAEAKPAVPQPVADERVRFEQWAADPIRSEKLPLERHPNGAYKDSRSYLAWLGWKSRAACCQPAEEGDKA